MFLEDLVNSTSSGNESATRAVDSSSYEGLKNWAEQIRQSVATTDQTVTTEEAMQAGWFACQIDNAAEALKQLHDSYSHVGSIGRPGPSS